MAEGETGRPRKLLQKGRLCKDKLQAWKVHGDLTNGMKKPAS